MLKLSRVIWVFLAAVFLSDKVITNFVNIICDYDKDYIRNVTCVLKPVSRYVKIFTVSLDVYRPMDDIMVNSAQLRKTSANRYMPGLYNVTKNLCNVMRKGSVENQFVIMFMKHISEGYEDSVLKLFRDCPYKGEVSYETVFDDSKFERPPMVSLGSYLNMLTLYNARTGTVYFKLKMYQELLRDVKG